MARYNFTNITLEDEADITDVMNNFNEIEKTGAIIDDLPKVIPITISASNWVLVDNKYEYTIKNQAIKLPPYIIDILFTDLTIIKSPIYAKPNSHSEGSVIIQTSTKPTQDLLANLIITRGISVDE